MASLFKNLQLGAETVDVSVENGTIAAIVPSDGGTEGAVPRPVVPAFYNCHTHLAMSLLRGYADDLELMPWLQEHIWPAEAHLTDEIVYAGTRLAILELIRDINKKLGITVIVITHQMSVVQEICNRVAILENGTVVEEGEVGEVFSNPRTNATRNLIYPEMEEGMSVLPAGGQLIRIIFNGAVKEPLLARMAKECDILASILGASTRSVGDRAYGYMLLDIPGGPEDLARAVSYLNKIPDITVQVEAEYAAKEVEA